MRIASPLLPSLIALGVLTGATDVVAQTTTSRTQFAALSDFNCTITPLRIIELSSSIDGVITRDARTALPTTGVQSSEMASLYGSDGNDSVIVGNGSNIIITGGGADSVTAGDGGNVVAGDSATVSITTTSKTLISRSDTVGGDDDVTTGSGSDMVVLGTGADMGTLGEGDNLVLGDSGMIFVDASVTLITSSSDDDGGDDTVSAGAGADIAVLGTGGDEARLGDGANRVLGDNGEIEQTAGVTTLTSSSDTVGGNDDVTTGSGSDMVVLGTGDDMGTLGDGDNRVLGDSGVIAASDSDVSSILASNLGGDGADDITAGSGADIVIAGFGADTVAAGAGNKTVIGDRGVITQDAGRDTNVTITAQTLSRGVGFDDQITTLGGEDIVLAGAGSDTVSAGAGRDIIHGDDADYTSSAATGEGTLTTTLLVTGGSDTIYAGDGSDLVVSGLGDDQVSTGNGDDVVLADDGDIVFRNVNDVERLIMTNEALGGDDVVTATNTVGDNVIIGQAGSDTVLGGADDEFVIADLAVLTLDTVLNAAPGQSAVDRILNVTSTRIDIAGDDTVRARGGSDIVIGGFGADLLDGEGAQDILIGDTAIYNRSFERIAGGGLVESFTIDTNFAFEIGGFDTFFGGPGADIMIGGLGNDLFNGDTANDLLFGDAYAGIFTATWSQSGFLGETAHRELLTSNFPGRGALEILSNAQQDSSIGAPLALENIPVGFGGDEQDDAFEDTAISAPNQGLDPEAISAVLAFLESSAVVEALATLSVGGVGEDVLREAIMEALFAQFDGVINLSGPAYEAVLNQIVSYVLAKLTAVDDQGSAEPIAAVAPLQPLAAE